jgi:acyl-CoA thioesterase-1
MYKFTFKINKMLAISETVLLTFWFGFWAPFCVADTTILALGDSLTQGYGLRQKDGFVEQLSTWMGQNGDRIRIINAGVSGDTSAGGLARVEWSLEEDVDAMIVALGGNDFLRGIDPAETQKNLDGIIRIGLKNDIKILLIGYKALGNYGPNYKQDFDAIYPKLAEKYNLILVENFIGALLGKVDEGEQLQSFLQLDMLHPNAKGVLEIIQAMGPDVQKLIQD